MAVGDRRLPKISFVMAVLTVLKHPHRILSRRAEPVRDVKEVVKLANDMAETMYVSRGVGLAAPQVGVSLRVVVLDVTDTNRPEDLIMMINPAIVTYSGLGESMEGCLSMPGRRVKVARHSSVHVRFTDLHGRSSVKSMDGFLAVAVQHEIDHLDGLMMTDRVRLNAS